LSTDALTSSSTTYTRLLMESLQHRFRRRANVVLLAALLLVPIALSGHTHATQSTHPCSVCAVTHHAPIVSTPALPVFAEQAARPLFVATAMPVGARIDHAPRTGRAPPFGLLSLIA
jgi:hypothetical protein